MLGGSAMKRLVAIHAIYCLCNAALATSQCPQGATCTNEAPVMIAAYLVGARNVCANAFPSRARDYSATLERLLNFGVTVSDREALANALASTEFPNKLSEVEAEFRATPSEKLEGLCSKFLSAKW